MPDVPLLAPFDESDWDGIISAFQDAPVLSFCQGWREVPEDGFRGADVRLGWRPGTLCVLATLNDDSVVVRATTDNEKLWELGDVFEIFLRDLNGDEYLELHVDPAGHRLQLRFASERVVTDLRRGQGTLTDSLVHDDQLIRARVRELPGKWQVLAFVWPGSLGLGGPLNGRMFQASFSRYDYSKESDTPVLSSTSRHGKIDFHNQADWTGLRLVL